MNREKLFANKSSIFFNVHFFLFYLNNKRERNEPKKEKTLLMPLCPYGHWIEWMQQASLHSSLTIAALKTLITPSFTPLLPPHVRGAFVFEF